jgi:RDD family
MSTNPFAGEFGPRIEDKRVGFGQRLVAAIIDTLAGAVFTLVLAFVLMQYNVQPVGTMPEMLDGVEELSLFFGGQSELMQNIRDMLPAAILAGIISAIAYSLIEGLSGASPGKRVSLVPGLIFLDFFSNILGLVIFFGCFLVFGVDRLALHDRIAQSAVYYREDVIA